MLRYAITDSKHFGDSFAKRMAGLLAQSKRLAAEGIDFIQLREKDLEAGELFELAEALVALMRAEGWATKLLVNGRVDVAAACAHGVHLTSHPDELTPQQVRDVFAIARAPSPVISVSCHTQTDVERARSNAADLVLFGPVFEKCVSGERVADGNGLAALHDAYLTARPVPVLALGGIDEANQDACLGIGAAGIAGIRLFE